MSNIGDDVLLLWKCNGCLVRKRNKAKDNTFKKLIKSTQNIVEKKSTDIVYTNRVTAGREEKDI